MCRINSFLAFIWWEAWDCEIEELGITPRQLELLYPFLLGLYPLMWYTNKIIGSFTTSRSGLQRAILDILFVRKKSYHSK